MTLLESIGLRAEFMGFLDRLLIRLHAMLKASGQGAREVVLEMRRGDSAAVVVGIRLVRASICF